jgi:hypothetical protein
MNAGDLVRIRQGQGSKCLWIDELALVVRKIPFYEMQGKVSNPYQLWFEVLLCDDGRLKTFREDYLRREIRGNR